MNNAQHVDGSGPFEARYLAFLETLTNLRPSLHRYCARMTGSVMDGEDVVQEALFEAYRKRDKFDDSRPLAQAHALSGNKSQAMSVLQGLEQLTEKRYVCSYEVARAYVLLREKDRAFRWFDKAVEDRSDCMVVLAVDPRLDSLRSDPRFHDLLRRVGLPQ
jgi:hypothetical protein